MVLNSGQLSLFDMTDIECREYQLDRIKRDFECTIDTPVIYGGEIEEIYGKGKHIKPHISGRKDTSHMRSIFLDSLLPLEDYDMIIVLLSGGKDSVACLLHLLELGVPREKIECWHHDIDGGHPKRIMDWKCTGSYVRALCEALGVTLRVSYREDGFFGELYRIGASKPIHWIDPDTGEIQDCRLSDRQKLCRQIKEQGGTSEDLKPYGYRMKFPAKAASLQTRWCSAYLKIMVADSLMINLDSLDQLEAAGGKRLKFPAKGGTHQGRWCSGNLKAAVQDAVTSNLEKTACDKKILVVSGERRGESAGRSRYNEIEVHRTDAQIKKHRLVHSWRAVIDWSEKDVWEIMKRWKVNPHPCYRAGWNRCSCAFCIFSLPSHFAGLRELYPEEFELLKRDEKILGFTLDNKKDLEGYIGGAESCLYRGDTQAIQSLISGEYHIEDIFTEDWKYPAGAFHGANGGPC